ncbi:hypothetical protein JVU11DRAFT_9863 [Chiua virens]|nr:hypothetical protein JVU11DRAFT_9863 [Chiua virens]
MLSNFIRRNGKRKGKKANESRFHSHQQSSSIFSPAVSPPVFDIHEEFSVSSPIQSKGSLMVELDFSDSNEEWFPPELLRSRGCSPRSSVHRAQTCAAAQNTHADSPAAASRSQSERVSSAGVSIFRKKSIPAPIMIPNLVPNIEIGHSDKSAEPPSRNFAEKYTRYIYEPTIFRIRRSLRNLRDHSCAYDFFLCTVKPELSSATKSGERESTLSDSYSSSETTIDPVIPRRMSRIQELPSPTPSMSTRTSHFLVPVVPDTTSQRKAGFISPRPRVFKNGVFDVPTTAVEVPLTADIQGQTQHSSQEETFPSPNDHSLDDFDFMAQEYLHSDTIRGQRRRMIGGANLARKYSKKKFPTELALPRHPGDSRPSAALSDHDYGELLNYDLTLSFGSANSSHSSHTPSSGSAQTFPETPMGISPLWSPTYALLPRSEKNQVLLRHSPSPKSAGLRSAKIYSSARAATRQLDKKNRTVVLRRSQSSLLPSAEVKEEVGITGETNASPAARAEPKSAVELQSGVRPHPLAHISTSSSYLLEEEALQALANGSSLTLSSISVLSLIDASIRSPTSVPLPASPGATPTSPALTEDTMVSSSSASPPQLSPTTIVVGKSRLSKSPSSFPNSWGSSFLPSPSPPVSLEELPSESPPPVPVTASSRASDDSIPRSFFPPPPYHTVVSERTLYYPGCTTSPSFSQIPPADPAFQHSRQASSASSQSCPNMRTRARRRPPLPMGPRKPSGPGSVLGPFVHSRSGSISSAESGDGTGDLWRKLQSIVSEPSPKFHTPPPKWRGLTLEAAQWTFTSEQLQRMVSQAIQQSSEGSSLRLLRLEVLDGEIADEVHRLELQHTDVKAQYKTLVRKRWALMGTLASHIEGGTTDGNAASRAMQQLADVLLALDQLADKMHDIVLQLSQLKSLRDVHNASALALAVRKINGVFVRQMAEKERLHEQVDTLQTERDEAWQHAEDIAQDYDTLNERVSESVWAVGGDADPNDHGGDARSVKSSRRSTRISAVRKSSSYQSQAGLRSSKSRSVRSSMSATRPTSLAVDIPPVPPLPLNTSIDSATISMSTGPVLFPARIPSLSPVGFSRNSRGTMTSGISDALALAQAQREVYEMLGLSLPPSRASSRRGTISWGLDFPKPPPFKSRPMSASLETRKRRVREDGHSARRRAIKSVVLDDRPLVSLSRLTFL